ncbi:MAG: hypothetical protein HZA08_10940 [Nitrospirae bacterium]|nr:hypothetical protein [Nitrospirota bacterium]
MNISEFSQEIIEACSLCYFITGFETLLYEDPVIKIRANIDNNTFIEIFFNSETDKHSFALIKNDKRIYGVDNTRNWHLHSFENPEAHLPHQPTSFHDFIKHLEENKTKWL